MKPKEFTINSPFLTKKEMTKKGVYIWLLENLWRFNLFLFEEEPSEIRITALAELSLLCSLLKKCKKRDTLQKKVYTQGKKLIYKVMHHPHFQNFIYTSVAAAFKAVLILWASLPKEKRVHILPHKQLERLIHSKNILTQKLTPFQQVELNYFLNLIGYKSHFPSSYTLYTKAMIDFTKNIKLQETLYIYHFTHIVFYTTDFGFNRQILSSKDLHYLFKINQLYLKEMLKRKHIDLVGELLMVQESLKYFNQDLTLKGWSLLNDELLPKKVHYSDKEQALLESKNISYKNYEDALFLLQYHPYLVTAMASLYPC